MVPDVAQVLGLLCSCMNLRLLLDNVVEAYSRI